MKRVFRAIAALFARLGREHEVLQLHLIDDEQGMFQLAQKTFRPPFDGPGDKLAWLSEMVKRSQIANPRHEVYTSGQRGFMLVTIKGDFGPTFLAPAKDSR